jgi:hypothetical protein
LKYKLISTVFILCTISACGQNEKNKDGVTTIASEKKYGLYIANGQRQGMQYFDSTKTEYNYRYYTMMITNDSIIPIHLNINISEAVINLRNTIKSKIFLLPRHLTPEEQQFDQGGMSKELKSFLDQDIDTPVYLNKILNPTERCVLTFGVLTDTKYLDPTTPFDTRLIVLNENSSALSIKLKINDGLIIPCGQFSYINK